MFSHLCYIVIYKCSTDWTMNVVITRYPRTCRWLMQSFCPSYVLCMSDDDHDVSYDAFTRSSIARWSTASRRPACNYVYCSFSFWVGHTREPYMHPVLNDNKIHYYTVRIRATQWAEERDLCPLQLTYSKRLRRRAIYILVVGRR